MGSCSTPKAVSSWRKTFFTKKLDFLEQAVAKREATLKIDTRADEVEFSKPFLEYWKAKIAKKKNAGGGG